MPGQYRENAKDAFCGGHGAYGFSGLQIAQGEPRSWDRNGQISKARVAHNAIERGSAQRRLPRNTHLFASLPCLFRDGARGLLRCAGRGISLRILARRGARCGARRGGWRVLRRGSRERCGCPCRETAQNAKQARNSSQGFTNHEPNQCTAG